MYEKMPRKQFCKFDRVGARDQSKFLLSENDLIKDLLKKKGKLKST